MAQYWYDAADLPLGTLAQGVGEDWEVVHGGSIALTVKDDTDGQRYIEITKGTSVHFLRFNPVVAATNFEVLAKIRGANDSDISMAVRGRGFGGSITWVGSALKYATPDAFCFDAGAYRKLGNLSGQTIPADNRGMSRLNVIDDTIQVRYWDEDITEPTVWGLEQSSWANTVFGEGAFGFSHYKGTDTRVYSFGVGTDGDPAPTGPIGGVVVISGTSSAQAGPSTASGQGVREVVGTLSTESGRATSSGSATRTITGSATHSAQQATHIASSEAFTTVSGTSSAVSGQAAGTATGTREVTSSSDAYGGPSTHTGYGSREITANSQQQAQRATSTGTAEIVRVGTSVAEASRATSQAVGSIAKHIVGTSSAQAQSAQHFATSRASFGVLSKNRTIVVSQDVHSIVNLTDTHSLEIL